MPDNGHPADHEESQGATGFDEGSTGLRGGDSPERELGSDDFLAPLGVKAGWIYRFEKPEWMELASSLQINPDGTVIELIRRLIWHLVELPKARGISSALMKELHRGGISAIHRHLKPIFQTHGGVLG
ncbi:hypothetical protein JTB14_000203 [Gonioctena quinquepunctata]|nr:hypothetical protein JTB14_000203 [Gonioctena quinquepunctata]